MKRNTKLRQLDGILLLDKASGISSNQALQRIKRLYQAQKAGHSGTLDPLASGMLAICFGQATKFAQFMLAADKRYRVQITFGVTTSSGDQDGDVLTRQPIPDNFTVQSLQATLSQFQGAIQQVPPMYSALKHRGQPLYKLARQGIEIERKPRQVTIYAIALEALHNNIATLCVHCSKGTYIRSLAIDLGAAIGCGAHVSALRRLSIGQFAAEAMHTEATLMAMLVANDFTTIDAQLLPMTSGIMHLPALTVTASDAKRLQQGQAVIVAQTQPPTATLLRLYDPMQQFLGVGELQSDTCVTAKRMLAQMT